MRIAPFLMLLAACGPPHATPEMRPARKLVQAFAVYPTSRDPSVFGGTAPSPIVVELGALEAPAYAEDALRAYAATVRLPSASMLLYVRSPDARVRAVLVLEQPGVAEENVLAAASGEREGQTGVLLTFEPDAYARLQGTHYAVLRVRDRLALARFDWVDRGRDEHLTEADGLLHPWACAERTVFLPLPKADAHALAGALARPFADPRRE